jgi:pantoate--beta-alanine ligase
MIKLIDSKKELQAYLNLIKNKNIGLVPTMGNLHEGHISLLKKSIEENDISVLTIFVNPTQFGPNEDFAKYPRTLDQDLSKIENLILHINDSQKEVIVFAPSSNTEIYPPGFTTSISIGAMKEKLCGKVRPTHFDGVTTVVFKIFKLINPTKAYFGQKDFQQCAIIKKMIFDLELPIEMKVMPIIRNSLGLALSSRNQYLTEKEMNDALHLPKTLKHIVELSSENKNIDDFIAQELKDERWDYLEVLDSTTLEKENSTTTELVIVGALKINKTRLLDNILVKKC